MLEDKIICFPIKNMKKLLSLIIITTMIFSLVACGNNKTDTSIEEQGTQQTTNEVKTPEELQKYYESYFSSDDVGFAGESLEAETEGMSIAILSTKDNEGLFTMKVKENIFEIYKAKDKSEYVHVKIVDTETKDVWYKYNPKDITNELFEQMSKEIDISTFKIKTDTIKSIKYQKTEEGIDYVDVVSTETETNDANTSSNVSQKKVDVNWTFGINANTQKIVSVSQKDNNVVSVVNFSNTEKIDIKIPKKTNPINEEEMMTLYMAVILSMSEETKN